MPYTKCSACGAKALVGATRCPRCQAPFVSYDFKGKRVETVTCANCGVKRPVAIGICPNCLVSSVPSGRRTKRGLVVASVAVAALMAVGYLISHQVTGPTEPTSRFPAPATADTEMRTETETQAENGLQSDTALLPATQAAATDSLIRTTRPSTTRTRMPAPTTSVEDTGPWETAIATTWVRVRSAPTMESSVLGMVDSAQRVRLGPPKYGWRPIRVGADQGWIDPRFFVVVSAPTP